MESQRVRHYWVTFTFTPRGWPCWQCRSACHKSYVQIKACPHTPPYPQPGLNLPFHSQCLWESSTYCCSGLLECSSLSSPSQLWSSRWHSNMACSKRSFLTIQANSYDHSFITLFYNTVGILAHFEPILLVFLFSPQESKNLVWIFTAVSPCSRTGPCTHSRCSIICWSVELQAKTRAVHSRGWAQRVETTSRSQEVRALTSRAYEKQREQQPDGPGKGGGLESWEDSQTSMAGVPRVANPKRPEALPSQIPLLVRKSCCGGNLRTESSLHLGVCVCVCVCVYVSGSVISDSLQPHEAHEAPLSMEFSSKNTTVDSHSLLQGIFLTQRWNLDLPHCRQILYHLSHQGSPHLCLPATKTTEVKQTHSRQHSLTLPTITTFPQVRLALCVQLLPFTPHSACWVQILNLPFGFPAFYSRFPYL